MNREQNFRIEIFKKKCNQVRLALAVLASIKLVLNYIKPTSMQLGKTTLATVDCSKHLTKK